MWAAVRPGGLLVVEDADFGGWCCHPPNDGFSFFLRAYSQVLHRRGGDPALGRKLYQYFLDAKIREPHLTLVQPARTEGEEKALAWSTLDATADAVLAEGITSEDELRAALTSLRRFTDDPATPIADPRIFRAWSRRRHDCTSSAARGDIQPVRVRAQ